MSDDRDKRVSRLLFWCAVVGMSAWFIFIIAVFFERSAVLKGHPMTLDKEKEELIAALEKATGPDQKLDEAIYGTVLKKEFKRIHQPHEPWLTVDMEYCPAYTASIDAAMTLVPEGFGWGIDHKVKDHCLTETTCYAVVRDAAKAERLIKSGDVLTLTSEVARHTTPAIALCIASLKARHGNN